jgi:hypothetical protein
MKCPKNGSLQAYIDGADVLTAVSSFAIAQHLAECEKCQNRFRFLHALAREVDLRLDNSPANADSQVALTRFKTNLQSPQILARSSLMSDEKDYYRERTPRGSRWMGWVSISLSIVTLIAVIFLAIIVLSDRNSPSNTVAIAQPDALPPPSGVITAFTATPVPFPPTVPPNNQAYVETVRPTATSVPDLTCNTLDSLACAFTRSTYRDIWERDSGQASAAKQISGRYYGIVRIVYADARIIVIGYTLANIDNQPTSGYTLNAERLVIAKDKFLTLKERFSAPIKDGQQGFVAVFANPGLSGNFSATLEVENIGQYEPKPSVLVGENSHNPGPTPTVIAPVIVEPTPEKVLLSFELNIAVK